MEAAWDSAVVIPLKLLGCLLALAALAAAPWQTAPALPAHPAPAAAPAALPATLHYVAHWRLLPAGTASLSWSNTAGGQRQIHFLAQASQVVNLFYPVHDDMTSTYNPATFCTDEASNTTVEGRRHRQTTIAYHPRQRELVLAETDLASHPPRHKHEVKPIPGCVADVLTALDYIRAQPLHVGDSYTLRVNEGGKTEDVRCQVDLRETIATPAGRFSAVRVSPTIIGDPGAAANARGKLWIWFSDDARHLPVQIQSQAFWGTLTAQLTN